MLVACCIEKPDIIDAISESLFGNEIAKIAFIALAAFFPVVLNTFEGFRSVPRELIEVARVFAFSPLQLWRRVVLPAAAPSIFTGIHLHFNVYS